MPGAADGVGGAPSGGAGGRGNAAANGGMDPEVLGNALANFLSGFASAFTESGRPDSARFSQRSTGAQPAQPQPGGSPAGSPAGASGAAPGDARGGGADAGGPPRRPGGFEQLGTALLGAFQEGVARATEQTEGLTEEDRQRFRTQGEQVTAFAEGAIGMMRNNPLFAFLEAHLGSDFESRRSGLTEATVNAWVEENSVPVDVVEPDGPCPNGSTATEPWTCPICIMEPDSKDESLCLLCDGQSWHIFHRNCVATWLIHNNSCPICRRNPVVLPPSGP